MHGPASNWPRTTASRRSASRIWRSSALLFILLGLLLPLLAPAQPTGAQTGSPRVDSLTINGTITAVTRDIVERVIDQAEHNGTEFILISLRSAGGNASAANDIVSAIGASRVPVVVWVPEGGRVQGAAVRILIGAHIAAMAPDATIRDTSQLGDAQPGSASDREVVSTLTTIATERGRATDWIAGSTADAFTLSGDQAVAAKAIDLVATDSGQLLVALNGRSVTVQDQHVTLNTEGTSLSTVHLTRWERLRAFITSPSVAYVLLCFGVLGIFLELASPGGFVAGTIGLACLLVGIYAFSQLPVNGVGLALMALAFVLLGVDLFVSSFGVLTLGGLASFIAGSYLVIDTDIVGYDPVARPVIWTAAALVIALALLVGWTALGSFRQKPQTGRKAMLGEIGTVREALTPNGMIFLRGEFWQATLAAHAGTESVAVGNQVEVTAIDGLLLTVIPASAEAIAAWEQRSLPADARRVLPVTGGVGDLPRTAHRQRPGT
ncbi:MAG: NfeD family protein [Thermomicrobiales bacterium]